MPEPVTRQREAIRASARASEERWLRGGFANWAPVELEPALPPRPPWWRRRARRAWHRDRHIAELERELGIGG